MATKQKAKNWDQVDNYPSFVARRSIIVGKYFPDEDYDWDFKHYEGWVVIPREKPIMTILGANVYASTPETFDAKIEFCRRFGSFEDRKKVFKFVEMFPDQTYQEFEAMIVMQLL